MEQNQEELKQSDQQEIIQQNITPAPAPEQVDAKSPKKKKKVEPKTKTIKKKKTPVAITKKIVQQEGAPETGNVEEAKQEPKSITQKNGAIISPKITLKNMNSSIDGRIKHYISKVIRWNMLSLPQMQLQSASALRRGEERYSGGPIKMGSEQVDTSAAAAAPPAGDGNNLQADDI